MTSDEPGLAALRTGPRPASRWNRGVWIRFLLAATPTVVFAILGYLQTH